MERHSADRGQRVVRLEEPRVPPDRGLPDPLLAATVFAHVDWWAHPVDDVFGESDHETIHLNWFSSPPTPTRPFRLLVTAGMSAFPMRDPTRDDGRLRWSELAILLPPDWPLDRRALHGRRWRWPFELTAALARMPHECDSILWFGHTVQFFDPSEPFVEGVPFHGVLLAETDLLPEDFHVLPVRPGTEIAFLVVIPLHGAELALVRREGTSALVQCLEEAGVSDIVDLSRSAACREDGTR